MFDNPIRNRFISSLIDYYALNDKPSLTTGGVARIDLCAVFSKLLTSILPHLKPQEADQKWVGELLSNYMSMFTPT